MARTSVHTHSTVLRSSRRVLPLQEHF